MALLRGIILAFFVIEVAQAAGIFAKKKVVLDFIRGSCSGKAESPMIYKEISYHSNSDGKGVFNLTIVAKRDIPGPLKAKAELQKCEKANTNKCQAMSPYINNGYCDLILHDPMWHDSYKALKPQWKCPIKKGTYKAVNALVNLEPLTYMMTESSLFKINFDLIDTSGKNVGCVYLQAYSAA